MDPNSGLWPADDGAAERWLATARADELIGERRRQNIHTQLATRETSMCGALAMASDHGDLVTVWTRCDHQIIGTVRSLGSDFVIIDTAHGVQVVVLGAIDRVLTERRRIGAVAPDRRPHLVDFLSDQAEPGDDMTAWTSGGAVIRGRFAGCGSDVVFIDTARGRTLVGVQSLEVVLLVGSG